MFFDVFIKKYIYTFQVGEGTVSLGELHSNPHGLHGWHHIYTKNDTQTEPVGALLLRLRKSGAAPPPRAIGDVPFDCEVTVNVERLDGTPENTYIMFIPSTSLIKH